MAVDCVIVNCPEVLLHPDPLPCIAHVPVIVPPVIAEPLKVPLIPVLVSVSVLPLSGTVKEKVPLVIWSAELKAATSVPLGVAPVTEGKHPLVFRNWKFEIESDPFVPVTANSTTKLNPEEVALPPVRAACHTPLASFCTFG